ncbi:hypothetical protein JCM10450v2_001696 [Rhodotorula kratochvilovae]
MQLSPRAVAVVLLCALLPVVVVAQDVSRTSTADPTSLSSSFSPAALNVASSAVPTATPAPSSPPPEAASPRPALATHIEPWSGVLGGLLLVTGLVVGTAAAQLPRAASGIDGLYAGALVVGLLVLKFSVASKLDPPSQTARGLYLLAAVGGGLVAAVPCALLPRATAPLAGALGGFAASVFLLSTRDDALIRPLGLRYILIVGLLALGFVLASIPRIQPPVLLVCTSAIGAFAVVLGVDCFTSAGLKELYVYVLGLADLFPKLEGHFRLTTGIIAELAATAALFFILMAIQSRFLSLFAKRDAAVVRSEREHASREEQLSRAHKRRSRVELSDWEEKYGAGSAGGGASSGESDDRTLLASPGMEKARSGGSATSFLFSPGAGATQSRSMDFLPKLELGASARTPGRPALATIQPEQARTSEWGSYVASRKVAVAAPPPALAAPSSKRASRALSMFSLSRRGASAPVPTLAVHADAGTGAHACENDDDDDDVPLAAVRSLSTGSLPRTRPATMYDLASPSGSMGSLSPPVRSRSRVSLALPAVLAAPAASPPLAQGQRPATLANVGRRHTLIDLSAPSTFDPYHDRARQAKKGAEPERIAVGERRRAQSGEALGAAGVKGKAKEVGGGARIMDFGELEEKHRKRLSVLQGTANEKVTSATALARYQAQQRAEADAQRRREARRSVDSSLHLLASPAAGEKDKTRKRASASMGSLSALLRRSPRAEDAPRHEGEEDVPLSALPARAAAPPPSISPPQAQAPRARRSSTQALVSAHASTSAPHLPPTAAAAARPYRPSAVRRHSLGTLLEVSHDAPPREEERVEKVAAWRRSGAPGAQVKAQVGEAALLQRTAEAAPPSVTKKKHDWLSY